MLSLPQSLSDLCASAGGWTGVQESPGLSHSSHCAHNKPHQDREGINGGGTTEIWYLGDGRGMAARVLPVPIPQRTLDVRKRQVVAPGKLNTGTVDLGQRDLESCVVSHTTKLDSPVALSTLVLHSRHSLPTVCLLCMWTPVVWSGCEVFILAYPQGSSTCPSLYT